MTNKSITVIEPISDILTSIGDFLEEIEEVVSADELPILPDIEMAGEVEYLMITPPQGEDLGFYERNQNAIMSLRAISEAFKLDMLEKIASELEDLDFPESIG